MMCLLVVATDGDGRVSANILDKADVPSDSDTTVRIRASW